MKLRVKSKFGRFNCKKFHPVFLAKDNPLTELLILHYHKQTSHGGVYSVLNILLKSFWIPNVFVLVKRLLKECLVCKGLNFSTHFSSFLQLVQYFHILRFSEICTIL